MVSGGSLSVSGEGMSLSAYFLPANVVVPWSDVRNFSVWSAFTRCRAASCDSPVAGSGFPRLTVQPVLMVTRFHISHACPVANVGVRLENGNYPTLSVLSLTGDCVPLSEPHDRKGCTE